MEPDPAKLRFQQAERSLAQQQGREQQAMLQFETPEELIRHDAAKVLPPPTLLQRLKASLARERPPKRGWWRRWFAPPPPES